MNYNVNYKLNYVIDDNDISQDTIYRKDIVNVFQLNDFFKNKNIDDNIFFKQLSDNVNNIYLKYKENHQIKTILNKIKEKLKFPFELENDMLFMYLFRYDIFFYFHNCIIDLHNKNIISEPNFKLLINSI